MSNRAGEMAQPLKARLTSKKMWVIKVIFASISLQNDHWCRTPFTLGDGTRWGKRNQFPRRLFRFSRKPKLMQAHCCIPPFLWGSCSVSEDCRTPFFGWEEFVALLNCQCQQLVLPAGDLHKIGPINFLSWGGEGSQGPVFRQLMVARCERHTRHPSRFVSS